MLKQMTGFVPPGRFSEDGVLTLEAAFPSDSLASFANLLRSIPALAIFARELIQLRLVLDANIVQQEIRFLLKRRNPAARSSLQEAIDAGVVIPLAPEYLDEEIEKYIDKISHDTGKPPHEVRVQWKSFRARLHVYRPVENTDPSSAIDPKDVPYKLTCDELGADAVYTRDVHFLRMAVPTVGDFPTIALRDYARHSSVSVGITVSAGLVLTISYASLRGVYLLIEKSLEAIGNLPGWVKLLLAAGVVAAVAHPKSRAKIAEIWLGVREGTAGMMPGLASAVEHAALTFLKAHQNATQRRSELEAALPKPRRRSALQYARVICVASKEPLSVSDIAFRMVAEGYTSRAKNFHRYLKRQLQASGQFIEVSPGRWTLHGADGPDRQLTVKKEPKSLW